MRTHRHGGPASPRGMTHAAHAVVRSLPNGQLANAYPPLTPLRDQTAALLVQGTPAVLLALVERCGSPLNLAWPRLLGNPPRQMTEMLRRHGVRHKVFYGAKVNKSHAFIHAAVQAAIGGTGRARAWVRAFRRRRCQVSNLQWAGRS